MSRVLSLEDTMLIGKHKDQQVEDLLYDDPEYLTWCVEQDIMKFDEEAIKKMAEMKII